MSGDAADVVDAVGERGGSGELCLKIDSDPLAYVIHTVHRCDKSNRIGSRGEDIQEQHPPPFGVDVGAAPDQVKEYGDQNNMADVVFEWLHVPRFFLDPVEPREQRAELELGRAGWRRDRSQSRDMALSSCIRMLIVS